MLDGTMVLTHIPLVISLKRDLPSNKDATSAKVTPLLRAPKRVSPNHCWLGTPKHHLAPGTGKILWACADRLNLRDEPEIESLADTRFLVRANELLNIVRAESTRPGGSFKKLATVNHSSGVALTLMGDVLGPNLTAALLERVGCTRSFANRLASEACDDPTWADRMAQAEERYAWRGAPYYPQNEAHSAESAHHYTLGAAEARQFRQMAGLDDVTIAASNPCLGRMPGHSVAFEELPPGVAGQMKTQGDFGRSVEIVLSTTVSAPCRALALLEVAWFLARVKTPGFERDFTLPEAAIQAEVEGVGEGYTQGEPPLMAVLRATCDWVTLPLERVVLELRARTEDSFGTAVGHMAIVTGLSAELVARNCQRVLDMAQRGVPL